MRFVTDKYRATINHESTTVQSPFETKQIVVEIKDVEDRLVKNVFFRRIQDAVVFIDGFNLHSELINNDFEVSQCNKETARLVFTTTNRDDVDDMITNINQLGYSQDDYYVDTLSPTKQD